MIRDMDSSLDSLPAPPLEYQVVRVRPRGRTVFFLLYLLLVLAGFAYLDYYRLRGLLEKMERVGWNRVVSSPIPGPLGFYLGCRFSLACGGVLDARAPLPTGFLLALGGVLLLGGGAILRPRVIKIPLRYGQHWASPGEVTPLVEKRPPGEIVDSGLPEHPAYGDPGRLMGYLGVYVWTRGNREERFFLRVPGSVERVHSMTYAGTGGGKTVGVFRPRLALDAAEGNLAIVLDTKYPNPNDSYLDTRRWFRAFGRRVLVVDPFGYEPSSVQLPVFDGVDSYAKALDVARYVYPPDIENADAASRVFVANARTLLAGIIYGLALDPRATLSFAEVSRIANLALGEMLEWFERHPEAKGAIQSTLGADKYVLSGAANRLVTDLEIFRLESASNLFTRGERAIDFEDFFTHPGMVHIVLPESQIRGSSGRAILRFFKRYFDQAILNFVEKKGKPLPIHVNYYYDEIPLFGYLPDLDADLATFRSRNVSVHMAAQSRAQLVNIYGEAGWRAIENNNIGTFYLIPGSYTSEEALYWSRMLGRYSFVSASVNEQVIAEERRASVTESERERELITPDELMRMGVGEMIVLVRRFPPIKTRTFPVDHPESPVHWVWKQVKEWDKEATRRAFQEVFSPPMEEETPLGVPETLEEAYRLFRALFREGSRREEARLLYALSDQGYVLLVDLVARALGVEEEALERLVYWRFLIKTPGGYAINPNGPIGEKELGMILELYEGRIEHVA